MGGVGKREVDDDGMVVTDLAVDGVVEVGEGAAKVGAPSVGAAFDAAAFFRRGFDEDPIEAHAADGAFEVTLEMEGSGEAFLGAFVGIGEGAAAIVDGAVWIACEVKGAAVLESKFAEFGEEAGFGILGNERDVFGGRVVEVLEVVGGSEEGVGKADGGEPLEALLGPELRVADSFHEFAADAHGGAVGAGGVEIAGKDQGVFDIGDGGEEFFHLLLAAGGEAFVFEVGIDDGDEASGGVLGFDVGEDGDATALTDFAGDAFEEEFVGGEALALFEFGDGVFFRGEPVVARSEAEDADVLQRQAAEDGAAVVAAVFFLIDLLFGEEAFVIGDDGGVPFFLAEVEGIDFDEFNAVDGVHVEVAGEVGGDFAVVGAGHAEVEFVEDQDVGLTECLSVGFDLQELFGGQDPEFVDGGHEGFGVVEGEFDEVVVGAAFDVPHGDAESGADVLYLGETRGGGVSGVEDGGVQDAVELFLEGAAFGFFGGEFFEFFEGEKFGCVGLAEGRDGEEEEEEDFHFVSRLRPSMTSVTSSLESLRSLRMSWRSMAGLPGWRALWQ